MRSNSQALIIFFTIAYLFLTTPGKATELECAKMFLDSLSSTSKPVIREPNYDENTRLISEIREKFKPEELLQIFDQRKFYELMDSRIDEALDILYAVFSNSKRRFLLDEFQKEFGKYRLPLLLDPGVASHLPELASFLRQEAKVLTALSNFELREKFSVHLGMQVIYRAMYLNEGELKAVLNQGIFSTNVFQMKTPIVVLTLLKLRQPDTAQTMRDLEEDTSRGVRGDLYRRIKLNFGSLSIPTSQYSTLAKSIVFNLTPDSQKQGRTLYTFKMSVQRIKLVQHLRTDGLFSNIATHNERGYQVGTEFIPNDGTTEMMVFNWIPPTSILAVDTHAEGAIPMYQIVP